MYKKILVPLDGSPLAEAVLPHAEALAKANDAEVVLLRVAVDPGAEFAFSDPALAASLVEDLEIEARTYMRKMIPRMRADQVNASFLIRKGAIAETILEVAAEIGADVIAMSTHGRSGVRRWLMGSIANRVITHSTIPVMVIHPKEGE